MAGQRRWRDDIRKQLVAASAWRWRIISVAAISNGVLSMW